MKKKHLKTLDQILWNDIETSLIERFTDSKDYFNEFERLINEELMKFQIPFKYSSYDQFCIDYKRTYKILFKSLITLIDINLIDDKILQNMIIDKQKRFGDSKRDKQIIETLEGLHIEWEYNDDEDDQIEDDDNTEIDEAYEYLKSNSNDFEPEVQKYLYDFLDGYKKIIVSKDNPYPYDLDLEKLMILMSGVLNVKFEQSKIAKICKHDMDFIMVIYKFMLEMEFLEKHGHAKECDDGRFLSFEVTEFGKEYLQDLYKIKLLGNIISVEDIQKYED